jgi:hypothetical protein
VSSNNWFKMPFVTSQFSVPYSARSSVDEEKSDEEEEEEEEEDDGIYDYDDIEDYYSSEEEEEESETSCECPNCTRERMFRNLFGRIGGIEDHSSEEEDNGEEDHSDDDDDVAKQCCVCFHKLTDRNPAVVLPCCGSTESSSTTSFCAKCISKCVKSQHSDEMFSYAFENSHVGECPRCRGLIAFDRPRRLDRERESAVDRKIPLLRSADTELAARFAGSKPPMRPLLMAAAYVYPHYIPIEILENDEERAHKLCRWGILKQLKEGELYAIEPDKQEVVHDVVEDSIDRGDDDPSAEWGVIALLVDGFFTAVSNYKFRLGARLLNQGLIVFAAWMGAFPSDFNRHCKPWQGAVLACMNVLLLIFVVRLGLSFLKYSFAGYATAMTTGHLIHGGPNKGYVAFCFNVVNFMYAIFAILGVFTGHRIYIVCSIVGFGATTVTRLALSEKSKQVRSICVIVVPLVLVYLTNLTYGYFCGTGTPSTVAGDEGKQQLVCETNDEFA